MRPNTTPPEINVPRVSTHLCTNLSKCNAFESAFPMNLLFPPPYTLSVLYHKVALKTLAYPLAAFMLAHPSPCTEDSVAGYFRYSGTSSLLGPPFRAPCAMTGLTDKTGQVLYT